MDYPPAAAQMPSRWLRGAVLVVVESCCAAAEICKAAVENLQTTVGQQPGNLPVYQQATTK
ncbi:MAG: hypothetical protein LBP91_01910 [Coriobacteriales bacterium]|nr:hypothetical protein [Coriobacteriales bacterium]